MTTDFYPWKLGDPESPGENSHLGGQLPRVAQFIFCPAVFFKSLLKLLQYCFYVFMFWFSGHEAYRILAPQAGTEPTLPELEGKVLTREVPGLAGGFETFDINNNGLMTPGTTTFDFFFMPIASE